MACSQNPLTLKFLLILQLFHIFHVFDYHQRDLEGDGILEDPKIQSRALLQLIQTVYQGVSVDIQLSGSLRNIQAVLEKLIDGGQRLLVKVIW